MPELNAQDFGLARVLLTAATAVTACGSFDWAAPELLMGGTSSKVSSAADIYRCALHAVRLRQPLPLDTACQQSTPWHKHAHLSSLSDMKLVLSLQQSVPTHVTCLCLCAQLWGGTLGAGHKGGAIPVLQLRTSALPACLRHSETCLVGAQ